jgi:PAS domain S-box-containing protein
MASTETNPIRILLVEDFHAETEVILRELKDAELNYEASKVQTEDEFKQRIIDFNPDIILSPYSLQGTNALKLLKIARKSDVHVPFILLAFDLSEDIAIDLLSEGIEDYVTRSTLKRVSVAIRKALERYKTELELRISESLYKEAQSIAKVGSWFMNPPSKDLNWSEEMYAIHGMEPGPVSIEKVRDLTLTEDHEVFDTSTERLLNGEDTPLVYRIRIKETGDIKYLLANGKVAKNAAGEIVSLSGTVQDISERMTAQLELERSQALLVEAQKIAKVGSWEWVVGKDEVKWSEEMYRIYERSEPKVLLTDVRSYIHPEDKTRVSLITDNDLTDALTPVVEYRIKLPSGEIKHVISSAKQIQDKNGKVVRLIGTLQDVTEYALINERVQTLSLVASETINGVGIHDSEGKILWVNKGFTRITGYNLDDVEGKDPWEVVSSDDTNQKLVKMSYEKVSSGKAFSADNVLQKKDGESVWVNVSYTPILDDTGTVTKIISIGTDITKLKELEQLQKITLERLKRSTEKQESQDT